MNTSEYSKFDGLALADLVKKGAVTATDLAELAIAGIEKINPSLNAVVEIFDGAFDNCDISNLENPSFCGVPTLIKDFPAIRGQKAEFGSELAKGFRAKDTMALFERIQNAGITILGRTTTSEHGLAGTTESRLYGKTRNPWDLNRSTSGSSGGSAAMVAAGVVPFAQGTDGGGSIRMPAACCGLVGLKPTRGRVSAAPYANAPLSGISTGFMLTRSVRDCAALLDVVSGAVAGDFYEIPDPVQPFAAETVIPDRPLKIALVTETWSGIPVDQQIVEATKNAALFLETLGHKIEFKSPLLDYEEFLYAQKLIWCSHLHHSINNIADATGRQPSCDNLQSTTLAIYERGKTVTSEEFLKSMDVYVKIARQVGGFFKEYDAMITPTTCILPEVLGTFDPDVGGASVDDLFDQLAPKEGFTALLNATGQPAISLPLYMSREGLPIGIQFVSKFADEATLFQLATLCEQHYQWQLRIPPVHFSKT